MRITLEKANRCEVLLKVTNAPISSFPLDVNANNTYVKTLENGETWENLSGAISINGSGNYSAVFELWVYDETTGTYAFSGKVCLLSIDVLP